MRLWIQLRNCPVFRRAWLGYRSCLATESGGLLVDFVACSNWVLRRRCLFADFTTHYYAAAVVGQIAFFCFQAILTPRLFRKNYRTFRICVIRDDGQRSRRLSLLEILQVWLCIMGTELAFLTVASLVLFGYKNKLPAETIRSISSLSLWLRFLLVGPYAVGLALRIRYPGFHLQATGLRYI